MVQTPPDVSTPARPRRAGVDLAVVTAARMALVAVWFGATTVLARTLGPAAFGLYALCGNAVRLATAVAGDPVDAAVMRSAPVYLASDRPRAVAVIRGAFFLRGGLGLSGLVVTAVLPWAISWAVFDTTDHRLLAVLTAAGVLGDLLLRSALGYFQVAGTFGRFLAVDAVWQLGRTAAVVALAATGHLTAAAAVGVYVGGPFAAFAVAVLLLPRDVVRPARPVWADVLDVARHARWVAVALAVGAAYERLDLFLLKHYRGDADVGLYGWAAFLAAVPDFLDGGVQTVLAPKVAPAFAAGRFNALNRAYMMWAIPIATAAGVVAVTAGGWAIRTLQPAYAGSVPAFRLLIAGTLFNLALTPLSAALLTYVAPRAATAFTTVGLAVVAIGGLIVIPRHGPVGAAAVIVAARVVVGLLTVAHAARLAARH